MRFDPTLVYVSLYLLLFGVSIAPAFLVWLGMMLISPPDLVGLSEERVQKLARLRRGFARLIFRSLIWFVVLFPIAGLVSLLTFAKAISPIVIGGILVLLFGTWWLYVVVGSLVHAWIALSIMEEGEAQ